MQHVIINEILIRRVASWVERGVELSVAVLSWVGICYGSSLFVPLHFQTPCISWCTNSADAKRFNGRLWYKDAGCLSRLMSDNWISVVLSRWYNCHVSDGNPAENVHNDVMKSISCKDLQQSRVTQLFQAYFLWTKPRTLKSYATHMLNFCISFPNPATDQPHASLASGKQIP